MKHEALVTKVKRETADTKTIFFTVNDTVLPFTAGQYISVYFPELLGGQCKAYSLSSAPFDNDMSITVKDIGQFSGLLCSLKAGDTLNISSPYGFFNAKSERPIIGIVGGVGVSPVWSIVRDELQSKPDRKIKLLYSVKKSSDVVLEKDISRLFDNAKNADCRLFVTQEATSDHTNRRISLEEDISKNELDSSQFYICGREDFTRSLWRQLVDMGVDTESISTETFFENLA